MATVRVGGGDDSYAQRAKRGKIASKEASSNIGSITTTNSNHEQLPSSTTGSSASDTMASTMNSSPLMSVFTPATSVPAGAPSSSSSVSPANRLEPLPTPVKNAWTDRNPWKTPQKSTEKPLQSPGSKPSQNTQEVVTPRKLFAPNTINNNNKDSDPFVVNYNINNPPLDDAVSWPQVGNSTTAPPSTTPHHPQPSISSTSSVTMVSGSQTPITDLNSAKKPKGEKTKWVPIPAQELQAAADAVARPSRVNQRGATASHSPRVNGKENRLPDDISDGKRGSRSSESKGTSDKKGSPMITATTNTRHDRNPSLTVPNHSSSSGSSRRVSPLHLTTSLPVQNSSQPIGVPARSPAESPTTSRLSHHATRSQDQRNNARDGHVNEWTPMGHRRASSAGNSISRMPNMQLTPRDVPYGQAPYPGPIWNPYPMPYYPPYPNPNYLYPQLNHSQGHSYSTEMGARPLEPPKVVREKRKRRPSPSQAPALAGYRAHIPETLELPVTGLGDTKFLVDSEPNLEVVTKPNLSANNAHTTPVRALWWAYRVDENLIERWRRRKTYLQEPETTVDAMLCNATVSFGHINDGDEPQSVVDLTSGSQIGKAILQNSKAATGEGSASHLQISIPETQPYQQTSWPAPGAGPSALDIGLAMGMPMHVPPPSMAVGMPQSSPTTSVAPRPDWPARDDPFVVVSPPSHYRSPISPYSPYHGSNNGHSQNYGADGAGSSLPPRPYQHGGYEGHTGGRGRWRDDRSYGEPRYGRGRGRGYFPRGRGFRGGFNAGRFYPNNNQNHQFPPTSPNPMSGQRHNATTVYIPDPVMVSPPMYPHYPTPPTYIPYQHPVPYPASSPANTSDSGASPQPRPPSPKPISRLDFPLDATRYKLLGQIEYYFSLDNVAKDRYLRDHMDSRGWVPLHILQSFRRMKELGVSDDVIRATLSLSQVVEIRHNHVRMVNDAWKPYVLPNALPSNVPEMNEQPVWYPQQQAMFPGYVPGGVIPQMYPPPPHFGYPHFNQLPQPSHPGTIPEVNGIENFILRRPQQEQQSPDDSPQKPSDAVESAESSDDEVVFLISEPLTMSRPSNAVTPQSQTFEHNTQGPIH